jgi:hypothetical protein
LLVIEGYYMPLTQNQFNQINKSTETLGQYLGALFFVAGTSKSPGDIASQSNNLLEKWADGPGKESNDLMNAAIEKTSKNASGQLNTLDALSLYAAVVNAANDAKKSLSEYIATLPRSTANEQLLVTSLEEHVQNINKALNDYGDVLINPTRDSIHKDLEDYRGAQPESVATANVADPAQMLIAAIQSKNKEESGIIDILKKYSPNEAIIAELKIEQALKEAVKYGRDDTVEYIIKNYGADKNIIKAVSEILLQCANSRFGELKIEGLIQSYANTSYQKALAEMLASVVEKLPSEIDLTGKVIEIKNNVELLRKKASEAVAEKDFIAYMYEVEKILCDIENMDDAELGNGCETDSNPKISMIKQIEEKRDAMAKNWPDSKKSVDQLATSAMFETAVTARVMKIDLKLKQLNATGSSEVSMDELAKVDKAHHETQWSVHQQRAGASKVGLESIITKDSTERQSAMTNIWECVKNIASKMLNSLKNMVNT